MKDTTLLATSPTPERLQKLIQEYFYSTNIILQPGGEVHNSTGALKSFRWTKKGNRYRFERINSTN